jgi:hypothetical protein
MSKKKFNPIIQTTNNYSLFSYIKGNRDVNPIHVRKLKQSFLENPLIALIIVNERYQIIDGQHRFNVLKELGMPINYVIVYGYGISEVQILNVNGSDWKKKDFLQGYVKQGLPDYIIFKSFQNEYPNFNFSTCLKLLSGLRSSSSKLMGDGIKIVSHTFERGEFKIKDLKESHERAKMILDYQPFFSKYQDNTFIITLMYLFENKNYNHKEMMKKLKIQPNKIYPCQNQQQYITLLEDIYNYFRKEKVSFKY